MRSLSGGDDRNAAGLLLIDGGVVGGDADGTAGARSEKWVSAWYGEERFGAGTWYGVRKGTCTGHEWSWIQEIIIVSVDLLGGRGVKLVLIV